MPRIPIDQALELLGMGYSRDDIALYNAAQDGQDVPDSSGDKHEEPAAPLNTEQAAQNNVPPEPIMPQNVSDFTPEDMKKIEEHTRALRDMENLMKASNMRNSTFENAPAVDAAQVMASILSPSGEKKE